MQSVIDILLTSGKKGVELGLYILLPVMVLMMSVMRLLDEKGILRKIAFFISPVLIVFGLPGLGVFAIIQVLWVSFAAPVSTFRIIDQDNEISPRKVAATLAAILTMSQANATLPLTVVGLNLPITMLSSLLGGLLASFLTYRIFARKLDEKYFKEDKVVSIEEKPKEKKSIIQTIISGAEEGLQLVLKAIPLLILAVFFVNILKEIESFVSISAGH